jgi:hypothetical protein
MTDKYFFICEQCSEETEENDLCIHANHNKYIYCCKKQEPYTKEDLD